MMFNKIKNVLKNESIQLVLCFSFFLFMIIFNITHSALWYDEYIELRYSQYSIKTGELYNAIISTFQPPLYNFLMHFWLKISQSLLWFRFFNIPIGLMTAFFIYHTNRTLYSKKVGMLTITVLAMCYQWVYVIQECSEYALMLMCLSASIYFYVSCMNQFHYFNMIGFILFSILAIYSQYGAVFVSIPLLVLFFLKMVLDKDVSLKTRIVLFVTYVFSFITFAIPLYVFFLSKQMGNQEIANHVVSINGQSIMSFPFVLGKIFGYFFNVKNGEVWPIILSFLSVILLVVSYLTFKNTKLHWTKRSIIIALMIGYFFHFILVKLQIYAMVHPGASAGFFDRYSYFYLPLFSVAFPILFLENKEIYKQLGVSSKNSIKLLCIIFLLVSFGDTIQNWHKALDDQYIKIWEEKKGWEDHTYLYGPSNGFYYYVKQLNHYDNSYLDRVSTTVDNNSLPKSFWAWRINFNGEGWQVTVDKARSLGYKVTIYDDSGYQGQLAYCTLEK